MDRRQNRRSKPQRRTGSLKSHRDSNPIIIMSDVKVNDGSSTKIDDQNRKDEQDVLETVHRDEEGVL